MIGIERCTPKFLKNWETQLFQKYLAIRFVSDSKAAPLGFAEASAFPNFSAVCKFQLHSAGVGSHCLIPSCVHLNATWYKRCGAAKAMGTIYLIPQTRNPTNNNNSQGGKK
jgi:hypothetical protein